MVAGPRSGAPPSPRACGIASLLALAAYAAVVAVAGGPFDAVEPWPLGGVSPAGAFIRLLSAGLGLALGWLIPGLSLAFLTRVPPNLPALVARSLGLGVGYLVAVTLAHGAVTGHAPGRLALLAWLALPPLVLSVRRPPDERPSWAWAVQAGGVWALLVTLAAGCWPAIAGASLNGDGTEVYELARSLDRHALPTWDLERPEGPGHFGIPAINPFPTNAAFVHAQMALLGRGEAAARLHVLPSLVLAAVLCFGLTRRRDPAAIAYVVLVSAVIGLWGLYYFGYEPAHGDLAAPAGLELLTTALLLAGLVEIGGPSPRFGLAFLGLACTVLYSAPVLATLFVVSLDRDDRRRLLPAWAVVLIAMGLAGLAIGAATGSLSDWIRQLHSEYWEDFVRPERRQAALPLLLQAGLATGGLPLLAARRLRDVPAPARAAFLAAAVYLVVVTAGSHKNLHYLAPVPFLMAAACLETAGRKVGLGIAVVATAFVLSWPAPRPVPTETADLGRVSWIDGLSYEEAAVRGGVVYEAFATPGGRRFAVGKHTFARYGLDLGGPERALFRLSSHPRDGWIDVAGTGTTLSVRDLEEYARWRARPPVVPSSWLFPAPSVAEVP